MELDLSPKFSRELSGEDGGSYHHWSTSDLPLLKEAKVGAGKLVLKPLGFALPHDGDSEKEAEQQHSCQLSTVHYSSCHFSCRQCPLLVCQHVFIESEILQFLLQLSTILLRI